MTEETANRAAILLSDIGYIRNCIAQYVQGRLIEGSTNIVNPERPIRVDIKIENMYWRGMYCGNDFEQYLKNLIERAEKHIENEVVRHLNHILKISEDKLKML